ncbi:ABC transporter ATP-binding protein [Leucobacter sp. OH2974_COT-288]|nr:ABC transporter ATP-binding protein [Leucobacter sp. OH2974_COT-288]
MTEKTLPLASAKTTWVRLGKLALRNRLSLVVVAFAFVISAFAALVTPIMIGKLVDQAAAGELTGFPWLALGVILAAILVRAITSMLWQYQGNKIGSSINRDLGIEVMAASLDLNAQTIEDAGSGDLVTRATNDLDAVNDNVLRFFPIVIFSLVYLVVMFFTVVTLSPVAAVPLIITVIGVPVLLWQILPRISKRVVQVTSETAALSTKVTENVRGLTTIKELDILDAREEVLAAQNRRLFALEREMVRLRTTLWGSIVLVADLPLIASLLWGFYTVNQGWTTWGVVATVAITLFNLRWVIDEFAWCLDKIREGSVMLRRVCGVIVLAEKQRATRAQAQQQLQAAAAGDTAVAAQHVVYGYDVERPVMKNINLQLQPGESLALVGRSGSGKTTLARLIAGSLTADQGTVTVLGKAVGAGLFPTEKAADGRPRLLICTQEAHQFVGTVADNLTVVAPDATAQQMRAALATVGATWADELPQGLDTVLGDGGTTLTRDQVQQLSLARIALADPHIIILDESTTQLELLDAAESVRGLMAGRTVIVISHDARIAGLAQRAVLLEEGEIVATGTPEEIFARA